MTCSNSLAVVVEHLLYAMCIYSMMISMQVSRDDRTCSCSCCCLGSGIGMAVAMDLVAVVVWK